MNKDFIKDALREDTSRGDITTKSLIPPALKVRAVIIAKEHATVCGLEVARQVFRTLDNKTRITSRFKDGMRLRPGVCVMAIEGAARSILTGERLALNFLGMLSGIATETSELVKRVKPYGVRILDTRKTTPRLRSLEKYAVRCGGGMNHRMGLGDMILIKDNHKITLQKLLQNKPALVIQESIRRARRKFPRATIEIEVEDIKEYRVALNAKPDIILLDNMTPAQIRRAVCLRKGRRPLLEASGNIRRETVAAFARTGIDYISAGYLTHSTRSIDFSLKITSQ